MSDDPASTGGEKRWVLRGSYSEGAHQVVVESGPKPEPGERVSVVPEALLDEAKRGIAENVSARVGLEAKLGAARARIAELEAALANAPTKAQVEELSRRLSELGGE